MSITKNGSAYAIKLWADLDLSTASAIRIQYTDPAGNTGELVGSVTGASNDYVQAPFPSATSIIDGPWRFEITCTIGGETYISYETATVRVKARFD